MKKNILLGFKDMGRGSITLHAPSIAEDIKKNSHNNSHINVRELKTGKLLLTKITDIAGKKISLV